MAVRIRIVCLISVFSFVFNGFCYSLPENHKNDVIRFLMVYETNKALNLNKSVLYYSKTKWLTRKQDSVVLKSYLPSGLPDTITFDTIWQHPVYLVLKLYFSDKTLTSNTFYFSADNPNFEAFIKDTGIIVSPKLTGSFTTQSSLNGLALILQAILEMVIAYLLSKIFGLSRLVVLMVLAANIASFPLYMINMPGFISRELVVFGVKAIVMVLIGLRKVPVYKVLLLLITLTIISLGLKELLFFVIKLI
jgi:hypothetical protein